MHHPLPHRRRLVRLVLRLLAQVTVLGLTLAPAVAEAQVWVVPRRPGKSIVHVHRPRWETVDLLVGERINGQIAGGVRLTFDAGSEAMAGRAAAEIEATYLDHVRTFDFVPAKPIPYVVYASYQEFRCTNLLPVTEGVLGVTATETLDVLVPHFGDQRRFDEISRHELAHAFTIQKVRASAREADTADPLHALPLWLVEGLAEHVANGELDDETRLVIRDLATDADGTIRLPRFFEEDPTSVTWTYAVGQARVAFLEETYGTGTVQTVLERAPELVSRRTPRPFSALMSDVTGDAPQRLDARFSVWIRRQAFAEWLDARQDVADIQPLRGVGGRLVSLTASPDGRTLLVKTLDPSTGRTRLSLIDPRSPARARRVAASDVPGAESLHPIEDRDFDLGTGRLVYVAESRGFDTLVVHRWSREIRADRRGPLGADGPSAERADRLRVSRPRRISLSRWDLVAAGSPVLSPEADRVAFVGLDTTGERDLYVHDLRDGSLTRLTTDPWTERHLAWGPDGIVYSSDATAHGKFDLFRLDPDRPGLRWRLTDAPRDHVSPRVLPDGRVLFVAWDDGHANLHEVTAGGTRQVTDVTTGVFDPSPGPDGGAWVRLHHGARQRVARVPADAFVDGPRTPRTLISEPPAPPPERPLDDAVPYAPWTPKSWRPETVFGVLGGGTGGVFGQVVLTAADRLRDKQVVLYASIYGTPRLTDGALLLLDQGGRQVWGAGPIQSLRFRVDRTFEDDGLRFVSVERFWGGTFRIRHPLDKFRYAQLDLGVGGVDPFVTDGIEELLRDGDWNGTGRDLLPEWRAKHADWFETVATVRLGHDTIRYHRLTGPISGLSLLADGSLAVQPGLGTANGSLRLDGEGYLAVPVADGANVGVRAGVGTAGTGLRARTFWLSSADTVRAAPQSGPDALLGHHFAFVTAEAQVPTDALVQLPVGLGLEAIAGVDAGAAADRTADLWDRRIVDVALGINIVVPPFMLRLHWSRPLDVGAAADWPERRWTPQISLAWSHW